MAPRTITEETRVQTSVRGLAALVIAVAVVTSTVLGTWWSLKSEVSEARRSSDAALQEIKGVKSEVEASKVRVDTLWQAHYSAGRSAGSNNP